MDEEIAVPIVFIGAEDLPILFVNQFVLSIEQNEFILSMAQLAPPILIGTEEEQREQARQVSYVPVKIIARFGMNRERLVQLAGLIEKQLGVYDRKQERA